jgi:hypothetical protein
MFTIVEGRMKAARKLAAIPTSVQLAITCSSELPPTVILPQFPQSVTKYV